MTDDVQYSVEGMVATIWLNRPHMKNSITRKMLFLIEDYLRDAEVDENIKAVLIRGRGGVFSTGSDLSIIQEDILGNPKSSLELMADVSRVWRRIQDSTKPTIAVVDGYCIAGGFELMISCDFAIASDCAKIGDYHVKRAVTGGGAPGYRLPRIVGLRRAKELMLTGKTISGRKAAEWNLVNDSVPIEHLEDAVQDFIGPFLENSPFITRITKQTLNCGLDADQNTLTVLEHYATTCVLQSNDAREALSAFLEKREPTWTNS